VRIDLKRFDLNKSGPWLGVGAALGVAAAVTFAGMGAAQPVCPRVGCHPGERAVTELTIPTTPPPAPMVTPAPTSSPVQPATTVRRTTKTTSPHVNAPSSSPAPSGSSGGDDQVVGDHGQTQPTVPSPTTTTTVPQVTIPTVTLFPSP